MTAADELRQAAAKVRETAAEVEYGTPWAVADDVPDLVVSADVRPYGAPAVARTEEGIAAWIALMSPALAEPLAAWLDRTADAFDWITTEVGGDGDEDAQMAVGAPLRLARAINGGAP